MMKIDELHFAGALMLIASVLVALDLSDELARNAPSDHLARELVLLVTWIAGSAWLIAKIVAARRASRRLEGDLETARTDLARAQKEVGSLSRGIGEAIATQLEEWRLTPSEREVAHLLLKGLGHREISLLRQTSEKTVRQQAASVYQKAGLGGRAELSAFFLEDLLVLSDRAA